MSATIAIRQIPLAGLLQGHYLKWVIDHMCIYFADYEKSESGLKGFFESGI
jgi:hypothetical protein